MKQLKKTMILESNYVVFYETPLKLKEWLSKHKYHYNLVADGWIERNNNGKILKAPYCHIKAGEMEFFACELEFQTNHPQITHINIVKERFFGTNKRVEIACDCEELDYYFEFSNKIYTRPAYLKVNQQALEKQIWENIKNA